MEFLKSAGHNGKTVTKDTYPSSPELLNTGILTAKTGLRTHVHMMPVRYSLRATVTCMTMITYKILEEDGIVIIEPSGPITRSDLEPLTRDVDRHIRQKGVIRGLIVYSRSFPRWHDLGAFFKDMKFVFAYQHKIHRVASVTDSKRLMIVHGIARHVLFPEIRHFSYGDIEAAIKWMRKSADVKVK
jgi:SpoIIAA-like